MHVSDITVLCAAGEGKDLQERSMGAEKNALKYHCQIGGLKYSY